MKEFKASNGLTQSGGIIGAIVGAAGVVSVVSESMSTSKSSSSDWALAYRSLSLEVESVGETALTLFTLLLPIG